MPSLQFHYCPCSTATPIMTDSGYYSAFDTGAEEGTLKAERREEMYALLFKTLREGLA